MRRIDNDQALRRALANLSPGAQRAAAGRFVQNVLPLCSSPVVSRAVEVALDGSCSEQEVAQAFRGAKAHAVKTYTACGSDTDWLLQAEHFVAAAAGTCLQTSQGPSAADLAWRAAMQARMARNCAMIETGEGDASREAEHQYGVVTHLLSPL